MANRGRSRVITRRPRSSLVWIASADVVDVTTIGAGVSLLDQSLTGAQVEAIGPFTILRTRGMIGVVSDQVIAEEFPFGAFGACVVSEPARAVGVGSLPTPITDEGSELWFLHQFWMTNLMVSVGAPTSLAPGSLKIFEFDSKAMRKVEEGQAVVFVIENSSDTDGAFFFLKFRMLIKRV